MEDMKWVGGCCVSCWGGAGWGWIFLPKAMSDSDWDSERSDSDTEDDEDLPDSDEDFCADMYRSDEEEQGPATVRTPEDCRGNPPSPAPASTLGHIACTCSCSHITSHLPCRR